MSKLQALVLVCKDCRKRKNGPEQKSKAVAVEFKRAMADAPVRPRVVRTSCLGLCPKGATAVAAAWGADHLRLAPVDSTPQVDRLAQRLKEELR